MLRSTLRFGLLLFCGAALTGCQSLRESAGLTKKSPDEFAVTTNAYLVIPPGFNLMPPSAGAAPTNAPDSAEAAQQALFGATDTAAIAANISGNFSPGERMLLATAGVQRADPSIRQQLQSDSRSMQGADPSFTARLLGAKASPNDGSPINADAELERRKAVPAPAAPKKSSGGWFDWF